MRNRYQKRKQNIERSGKISDISDSKVSKSTVDRTLEIPRGITDTENRTFGIQEEGIRNTETGNQRYQENIEHIKEDIKKYKERDYYLNDFVIDP